MSGLDNYNGNSLVGMVGKQCVAIASDTRFGLQFSTVSTNSQKVYKIQDNILLGVQGLATDMQTFALEMKRKVELYRIKEEIDLTPELFANLVSTTLYEKRFGSYFVGPVVVGLDVQDNYKPYVCGFDSIGCPSSSGKFEIGGTASDQLLGTCEAFFKEEMEPEVLFEAIGQGLICSVDRDCFSGYGGLVYLMTPGNISVRKLKVRQD